MMEVLMPSGRGGQVRVGEREGSPSRLPSLESDRLGRPVPRGWE